MKAAFIVIKAYFLFYLPAVVRYIFSKYTYVPGVWPSLIQDQAQESRLAGPVFSDLSGYSSLFYLLIHIREFKITVALSHIRYFQYSIHVSLLPVFHV